MSKKKVIIIVVIALVLGLGIGAGAVALINSIGSDEETAGSMLPSDAYENIGRGILKNAVPDDTNDYFVVIQGDDGLRYQYLYKTLYEAMEAAHNYQNGNKNGMHNGSKILVVRVKEGQTYRNATSDEWFHYGYCIVWSCAL